MILNVIYILSLLIRNALYRTTFCGNKNIQDVPFYMTLPWIQLFFKQKYCYIISVKRFIDGLFILLTNVTLGLQGILLYMCSKCCDFIFFCRINKNKLSLSKNILIFLLEKSIIGWEKIRHNTLKWIIFQQGLLEIMLLHPFSLMRMEVVSWVAENTKFSGKMEHSNLNYFQVVWQTDLIVPMKWLVGSPDLTFLDFYVNMW